MKPADLNILSTSRRMTENMTGDNGGNVDKSTSSVGSIKGRVNHDFRYPKELGWDVPERVTPCIKLSFFFRKLDTVSWEDFYRHCAHVHADLTVALECFKALQVQRYVQSYQKPEFKQKLQSLGFPAADFDAYTSVWFRSWDDVAAFFSADEQKPVGEDGARFMNSETLKVMATEDVLIFGRGVPDLDGGDGITYRTSSKL
ncbi:uncharacterized protein B0I36DRAFT_379560 [Microdochium trichocladiopsis]|uniref:EthD domain-containing protein n=1 Tax=Microdochium trichocladiopsis TaxID=1682393 RepID=A0A9P9BWB5_9PEZI|nr:uncharacterized protein B0I36DRAFT_379560 [Microdochium trichocladiopsis]KAH7040632.1 hypothetical protein B0I36DRAFT_379560 [Microdochium trichocladiopsis]